MRKLLLAAAVLIAAVFVDVGVAHANIATANVTCSGVTFNYSEFPTGSTTVAEAVQVDGVTVASKNFNVTNPPPTSADFVAIAPAAGPRTITATADWNIGGEPHHYETTVYLTCGPPCVAGTPNPAGAHASGNAYSLYAKTPLLTVPPTSSSTSSQSGVGTSHQSNVALPVNVPGVASIGLLTSDSTSMVTSAPAQADDVSTAAVANVNLLSGLITATTIGASAEAIASGDGSAFTDAGSTFQNLVINGVQYANVAPNTKVSLPGLNSYVILRERIASTSGPAPGVLSGGTYAADITVNMIHVVLLAGSPLSTEIIVAHAQAHADFPQTATCPGATRTVSGHAFDVGVENALVGDIIVGLSEIPATGGSQSQSIASAAVPPPPASSVVTAGASSSSSTGTVGPASSTATSKATVANASILGGVVQATVIQSQSNSTATSAARSSDATGTQLINITINGSPIANNPAPNTTILLPGIGFVILNEQIPDAPASGHTGLTVRSIRVHVNPVLGVPATDIIVAEAHSDATFF
jgi:hypothetical protein